MNKSLDELMLFVKHNLDYHAEAAAKQQNPWKSKRHLESTLSLADILEFLEEKSKAPLPSISKPAAEQPKQPRLWLSPSEVEGLPAELTQELSAASYDKTELAILSILEERGGIASLDQILVGLYRKTGEINKRNTLTSKLYRMVQRGQIYSVPNKKGIYSNKEISSDEAAAMFSDFSDDLAA